MTSPNARVVFSDYQRVFASSHFCPYHILFRGGGGRSDFPRSPAPAQSHSRPPPHPPGLGGHLGREEALPARHQGQGAPGCSRHSLWATRGKQRRKSRFWAACPAPGPGSRAEGLHPRGPPTPPHTHRQDTRAGRRGNPWARAAVHGLTLPSSTKTHPPSQPPFLGMVPATTREIRAPPSPRVRAKGTHTR